VYDFFVKTAKKYQNQIKYQKNGCRKLQKMQLATAPSSGFAKINSEDETLQKKRANTLSVGNTNRRKL